MTPRPLAIAVAAGVAFFAPLDATTRKAFHETLQQLACHHDPRCAFRSEPD